MDIEGIVLEKRGVDHEDNRRALFTAFNGDLDGFTARHLLVWKTGQAVMERTIDGPTSATRTLFYLLEGTARLILREFETGHTMMHEFQPGNRLLLPSYDHRPIDYYLKLDPGSIMAQCGESGTGYQTAPRCVDLHVAFNGRQGDSQSFQARQVKMAKIKTELPLGAHSHTYREFFHILTGARPLRDRGPREQTTGADFSRARPRHRDPGGDPSPCGPARRIDPRRRN